MYQEKCCFYWICFSASDRNLFKLRIPLCIACYNCLSLTPLKLLTNSGWFYYRLYYAAPFLRTSFIRNDLWSFKNFKPSLITSCIVWAKQLQKNFFIKKIFFSISRSSSSIIPDFYCKADPIFKFRSEKLNTFNTEAVLSDTIFFHFSFQGLASYNTFVSTIFIGLWRQ